MENFLPAIPAKRYFTIGEVSDLCGVKPYVLRYWEQEFTQLKPMKRRGNRRYYQHHEVLLIRRIRELLYEQGFTISGARNRLVELVPGRTAEDAVTQHRGAAIIATELDVEGPSIEARLNHLQESVDAGLNPVDMPKPMSLGGVLSTAQMRSELLSIRVLLTV
jgi:DNA-binding transcriptional MerR regulator